MPEQSRASQSAEIATRAHEIAQSAQRDIRRVETALTDRIEELRDVMLKGIQDISDGQRRMTDEIVALKIENAKRTGAERLFKWALTLLVTIALGLAGIFASWHHEPPTHH